MEAVELRRLDSSESLLCLRFCDGEEVQVSQATLLRSPIISNVLEVLDEEEDDAPACGVVHAPAGLVRNWLRFVQPIEEEEQPAKGLDSSGDGPALTLALKVCSLFLSRRALLCWCGPSLSLTRAYNFTPPPDWRCDEFA